jgi:hypothetical protein
MTPRSRNILIIALAVILAFGIGAAWQFTAARSARAALAETQTTLEATRQELAWEQLQATLAMAAIAAQLGNHERSRQLASDFFSGLQQHAATAPASAQSSVQQLLEARDATITLLSRASPESGLQLTRMLVQYRQALGRDAAGLSPVALPGPDSIRG